MMTSSAWMASLIALLKPLALEHPEELVKHVVYP